MYLYFSDYSTFASSLKNDLPNIGKVIKVFALENDPRQVLGKPNLTVVESSGEPFTDKEYDFQERGIYTGAQLEHYLEQNGHSENAKRTIRALFRFATREDTQFTQRAMTARSGDKWLIDHPLKDLDLSSKPGLERNIHLDIFFPKSIEALRGIVDLDNPNAIYSFEETILEARRRLRGKEK